MCRRTKRTPQEIIRPVAATGRSRSVSIAPNVCVMVRAAHPSLSTVSRDEWARHRSRRQQRGMPATDFRVPSYPALNSAHGISTSKAPWPSPTEDHGPSAQPQAVSEVWGVPREENGPSASPPLSECPRVGAPPQSPTTNLLMNAFRRSAFARSALSSTPSPNQLTAARRGGRSR